MSDTEGLCEGELDSVALPEHVGRSSISAEWILREIELESSGHSKWTFGRILGRFVGAVMQPYSSEARRDRIVRRGGFNIEFLPCRFEPGREGPARD